MSSALWWVFSRFSCQAEEVELQENHAACAVIYRTKGEKMSEKTCSICGAKFTEYGNNPAPFGEGRCCDDCNWLLVVPVRILRLTRPESLEALKKFVEVQRTLNAFSRLGTDAQRAARTQIKEGTK